MTSGGARAVEAGRDRLSIPSAACRNLCGAVVASLGFASAAADAQTGRGPLLTPDRYVVDGYSGLLQFCAISHPTFDIVQMLLREQGLDEEQLGDGHWRFSSEVEYGSMQLELKLLEDGASHCVAYYEDGTVDLANAAMDELVSVWMIGDVTSGSLGAVRLEPIQAAEGGRAFRLVGPPYNLFVQSYPLATGGAALAIQVTGASQSALDELGLDHEERDFSYHAYAPSDGEPTSFRLLFSFHCHQALPDFSHAVARLKASNAKLQDYQAGTLAHWPPIPFSVYVEAEEGARTKRCAVTAANLSLAQVNHLGREVAQPLRGDSVETEDADGTRSWQMAPGWAGDVDGAAPFDYRLSSYASGSGAGLLLEATIGR